MLPTHGIITDTSLDYLKQGVWTSHPIDTSTLVTAGDYFDLAIDHNLTQLWVLPGTQLSSRFSDADDSFVTSVLDRYNLHPHELAPFIHGWKRDFKGEAVDIVLPEYIDQFSPLLAAKTSRDLYAALFYLHHVLGTSLKWTSGRTGVAILQTSSTARRADFIRPCMCDLTPFYDHAVIDLSWSRPLSPGEAASSYLHVVDRNNMYLAAMAGVRVGAGEYSHVDRPTFNKQQPGVWHIRLSGVSPFNGVDLPHPTDNQIDSWQDTAMVICAMECGYQVELLEAYVFTEAHTTFRPFYDQLRDAIYSLQSDTTRYKNELARAIALKQCKLIYTRFTGLLGHKPGENETRHWYNRPEWRNAIVGEAKRRMFVTLKRLLDQGVQPIAVYVDGLYLISNEPDIAASISPAIELSQQLGKYKLDDMFLLSDVAHLVTDKPYTLVAGLAEYVRSREVVING